MASLKVPNIYTVLTPTDKTFGFKDFATIPQPNLFFHRGRNSGFPSWMNAWWFGRKMRWIESFGKRGVNTSVFVTAHLA